MKKLISILLVMTIILSCLALVGCEWFGGEQTTATTTTTTAPPPVDPSTIEFEHGDNFTEEDIEFVRSLHGVDYSVQTEQKNYSFSDILSNANDENGYLYQAYIDIDNAYYICAYIDFHSEKNALYWSAQIVDITKFTWFKFNDLDSIPSSVGDLENALNYILYDCTLVKELKTDSVYTSKYTYYARFDNKKVPKLPNHDLLIFYPNDISANKYIERFPCEITIYELFYDKQNSYYVKLLKEIVKQDGTVQDNNATKTLGEYYDILSPFFKELTELEEIYTFEGEEYTYKYIGIDISVLQNIFLH